MDGVHQAASQFQPNGSRPVIRKYGFGNINDTYLVTPDRAAGPPFILQRLNTHVFPRPDLIIRNIRTLTTHLTHLPPKARSPQQRWEIPRLIGTRDGEDYYLGSDGSFWRALTFIAGATTYQEVQDIEHARQLGWAVGAFHALVADLPAHRLHDTLPGFHITPRYLRQYDEVLAQHGADSTRPDVRFCLRAVEQRRAWVNVLEEAKAQGTLRLRPTHGDPKINNILIDDHTGQAVSIVDLDTVKPGLALYDIGDCMRSGCNPLGEEPAAVGNVRFETDLCRAILEGYLSVAGNYLSHADHAYIYDSIRLMTFECGLRFWADYLAGNVYFRTTDPERNLRRAVVQFKLTDSIEAQETEIRAIIRDLLRAHRRSTVTYASEGRAG